MIDKASSSDGTQLVLGIDDRSVFRIIDGALLCVKVEDGTALGVLLGIDVGILDGIKFGKVLNVLL